jgi:transcriptional regulator GlxA family with amidase domain
MTKRIGFIGYDNITALDMIAPLEAFGTANTFVEGRSHSYELIVMSASGKSFRSELGVTICPSVAFKDAPSLDTILVPGGAGLRDPKIAKPVVSFLKARARSTRRLASVCTGLEALAQAGLMNGRRATTHWRFAAAIAKKFPRLLIDSDDIYQQDGKYYSSAGITAGIDLSLSLISDDLGERIAMAVARELVVYLKRSGGQAQFSEPLQFQTQSSDGFSDLAAWMLRNLNKELSVEILAARVNLGARHFSRRFKSVFGLPPAEYVERLRLDEARKLLPTRRQTVDNVAALVGYSSADSFRRAFERRFGVAPSVYEKRFGHGH